MGRRVVLTEEHFFARQSRFKWLSNVNYASFLAEIWPKEVRRVDLSRCRVIKWIVAPFHGNLPNLSNDSRTFTYVYMHIFCNTLFFVNFITNYCFLNKTNFLRLFMKGHIIIHVSLHRFIIMQCCHIFINNVLSNKYFVILSPESIQQ